MKTVFTQVAKLKVVPIASLSERSWTWYKERYPEAEYLVMTAGGICYAIAGSKLDAELALEKLNELMLRSD